MDHRAEVRDFLVSRRGRLGPDEVGLVSHGRRRVPGLRRSEVAQLAGVSVEYYTRLERGDLDGASDGVLDALARGLRLDDAERAHLVDLARASTPRSRRARTAAPAPTTLRPSVQRILDAMPALPAFVRDGHLDVLAANAMGRALYSLAFAQPRRPVNLARFVFLDPGARLLHPSWTDSARTTVSILRTEAGRDPYDRALTDLVGELSTRSEEFRELWATHDVTLHRSGRKHFRHPEVGDLDLTFDALDVPGAAGLTLTVYSAEPGTVTADGLALLGRWAADHADDTGSGPVRDAVTRSVGQGASG